MIRFAYGSVLLSEEIIHYSSGSQPGDWEPPKGHKIHFKGYKINDKMWKYVFFIVNWGIVLPLQVSIQMKHNKQVDMALL